MNLDETHTYTLVSGFGNNAFFAIAGNQLRTAPGYLSGLGATFSLRIKDTDSAGLSVEQTFTLRVIETLQGVAMMTVAAPKGVREMSDGELMAMIEKKMAAG